MIARSTYKFGVLRTGVCFSFSLMTEHRP